MDDVQKYLIGMVFTMATGVLAYWLKEGFSKGKESTSKNEAKVEENKNDQINLERRILKEIQELRKSALEDKSRHNEAILQLDKTISLQLSDLASQVKYLSATAQEYQRSVVKLEGRFEDLAKLREDVYRESETSQRMFNRIFEVIDRLPRDSVHKNLSRERKESI